METTLINRREFLKLITASSGALAGSLLLAACTPDGEPLLPQGNTPSLEQPDLPATSPAPSETLLEEAVLSPSPGPSGTPVSTPTPLSSGDVLPGMTAIGEVFNLPSPRQAGGMPLMQALHERHSTRSFREDAIPAQALSDLLWAAFGINRPANGGRTAPSAYDARDIEIFLTTSYGLFRYSAENHGLRKENAGDLRSLTGTQSFVRSAPLNLVYVSDYRKFNAAPEDCERWSWAHSGCIAQNVYLACSSLGLATVVRSTINREPLSEMLGLGSQQHITLAQTIGYPD